MIPYIIVSIICLIVSLVYEHFSHGVISIFMLYAFVIPLVAGITKLILNMLINNTIYRASWITLLVYSYMRGVIEIFGTTNRLLPIFSYVGVSLLFLSINTVDKRKSSN